MEVEEAAIEEEAHQEVEVLEIAVDEEAEVRSELG